MSMLQARCADCVLISGPAPLFACSSQPPCGHRLMVGTRQPFPLRPLDAFAAFDSDSIGLDTRSSFVPGFWAVFSDFCSMAPWDLLFLAPGGGWYADCYSVGARIADQPPAGLRKEPEMKKTAGIAAGVAFFVAVLVSSLMGRLGPATGPLPPSAGQMPSGAGGTVFERVIDTGKIRVGYVDVAVACEVDPTTKQASGTFVDILNKMAENLGLTVEFAEEVGWGTMIAGLQTGRYDMVASPVWPNSSRARQVTFSDAVYYSAIGIWVRPDETRFTPEAAWATLNDPEVKIGAIDGSTGETIAQTQFPRADLKTFPELTAEGQAFLDVRDGKIDAFFEEPAKGLLFLKNNPGAVKNIASNQPVKVFANVFIMPAGEYRLKGMLDAALEELQNSGFVDRVISKYEPAPKAYYRVAAPYRSSP
jgi:ABC-type amino acid transport substrate-binding protein